jgi:hypothetical protein
MIISLTQALTLLIWFLLSALLAFLLLIARFYERTTHERTYYWGYLIPILCFGIASVQDALNDRSATDLFAELMWSVGGVVLLLLCYRLYQRMTNE